MGYLYSDITEKIIHCFYEVYSHLGIGFLESVYEKAILIELEEAGLKAESQKHLNIKYKGQIISDFQADIVVDDSVIIEIKAVSGLAGHHKAQLFNYLKATGIKIGLLVNYGRKLEFKRIIY